MIGNAANQHESPVAIAAIDKALLGVDLQPDARMAEAGSGDIARP